MEIRRLESRITREILWVYVLSLLRKRDGHAYALRTEINEKFGFLPGNVSVYVVLYKLEKRGFVKARHEGNRKVYTITADGKKLLESAKKSMNEKQKLLF
ncbi:PadR family transcriptional regulator [Candidatus Micrarchaeota archaeon]|nr:PadR family transcriptional regulator [Candidatus Micrarchaeota archaeon]MBU1939577.1 PadR family transcriptional regulator [Candidatus Micrarchaeota archaeon]